MLLIDTETTGLLKPEAVGLMQQPYITELCIIQSHPPRWKVEQCWTHLIKPPIEIPAAITKSTGINNEMVSKSKNFNARVDEIISFFFGQRVLLAHNLSFDVGMLHTELARINAVTRFPWPPIQICSVEATYHLQGFRLNLTKLHHLATNKDRKESHRAEGDVLTLLECVAWMWKNGLLDKWGKQILNS